MKQEKKGVCVAEHGQENWGSCGEWKGVWWTKEGGGCMMEIEMNQRRTNDHRVEIVLVHPQLCPPFHLNNMELIFHEKERNCR